jgi:hypothetical protein
MSAEIAILSARIKHFVGASLTFWVTPEAVSKWQAPRRKTMGAMI